MLRRHQFRIDVRIDAAAEVIPGHGFTTSWTQKEDFSNECKIFSQLSVRSTYSCHEPRSQSKWAEIFCLWIRPAFIEINQGSCRSGNHVHWCINEGPALS